MHHFICGFDQWLYNYITDVMNTSIVIEFDQWLYNYITDVMNTSIVTYSRREGEREGREGEERERGVVGRERGGKGKGGRGGEGRERGSSVLNDIRSVMPRSIALKYLQFPYLEEVDWILFVLRVVASVSRSIA